MWKVVLLRVGPCGIGGVAGVSTLVWPLILYISNPVKNG